MRGDEEKGREAKRRITGIKTREMMETGIKREVDCEHLVFEADCVGWLLCYHITLILSLLFVRELRERDRVNERAREWVAVVGRSGYGVCKNQHANNTTLLT